MSNHIYLSKLSLINFKNYQQADVSLSPDINCFIGPNGAGKTNILDAIYYLSMCKSYLNPIDSQNILFDENFFVIQSTWNNDDTVYCGVKKGQKKVFKKNKVTYEKLADHIGLFPSVMISPYDRNLILEGSEVRRKWMDGIISQFDRQFLHDLIKYGKVLSQRNALLKNMGSYGFFDQESISVWNEQLIEYGNNIHAARKKIVDDFIPIFQKYYQWLSNNNEEVSLTYRSQLFDSSFEDLLAGATRNDQRKQYTTVGTHKDDFIFTIKGHPIKKFGSQGQQKSYLIALKLAQYEWLLTQLNRKPVLLLDDIFDKLDNGRVERLMQMVSDQDFGQVLITDTDKERIDTIFKNNQIEYKAFEIEENTVVESTLKTTV
ncbi:DNA replication/repair protein RecF [Brumimicrobium aurantiacum]|uniref:DNA replication/repair protein RecF n=1 Tax=Brumimicrobium aurantiacum TaxID=1737063 RepID=UPI001F0C9623|nr:DNA replication/repair protein RecF [Brumimicrobium aurantiacum]